MAKVILRSLLPLVALLGAVAGFLAYKINTGRPARLLAQGEQAVRRGDFEEVSRLIELLEQRGDPQAAHLLRGETLVYQAEAALKSTPPAPPGAPPPGFSLFRRALAEFEKIPQDGPQGAKSMVLAGECLMYLGERRLAEERLKNGLERDPDNLDAHRLLAAIYMDLNNPREAVEQFQEWARLDADNGLPYRWIGFFKKDYYKADEAIDAYQEALKRHLTPEARAAALKELAQLYAVADGDYQRALDTLAQGPTAFDDDLDVLALRIDCLRNLPERTPEAVRLLEKALQEHPSNPQFLMLRAQAFAAADRLDKALPLLEKAVERDPYDLKIHLLLTDAYRQLKKDALAEKQKRRLEEVQKMRGRLSELIKDSLRQPWNDALRVEIAARCLKMNGREEARTWLRAALTCNPNNQTARQLLSQLP